MNTTTATLQLSDLQFQDNFSNFFAQVCATSELTLKDLQEIKTAILASNLNPEELNCVHRLFYAVRRGRITLSDT